MESIQRSKQQFEQKKDEVGPFYVKVETLLKDDVTGTHDERSKKVLLGLIFLIEKFQLINQQIQEFIL